MKARDVSAIGLALAAGAAAVLVSAGGGAAASTAHPHAALAKTPKLNITISKGHFSVAGPRKFAAGRVDITLTAKGSERSMDVALPKKGYTFADARKDIAAFGSKQGSGPNGSTPKSALKHLDRVVKDVNFYGGLDAQPGQTEHGSIVLPKAGTYILFNDSGNLPSNPTKLTVTGPEVKRAAPHSSATVTALTTRRFGGAKTLPAKGTLTFRNKSTESPHFLELIHVTNGTTAKDVLTALLSNSSGPPSFVLKGQVATDTLGEGNAQTLTYHLEKGEYVELCFFPDPKTGMPHAFMGMIGIVHLT